jgi:hypothetical protein
MKKLSILVAACALMVTPALAQQDSGTQQAGLVNVNLGNLSVAERAEIANNLNVDVSQIPLTVQVPIGIAANVCGVSANVLAQSAGSGVASCDAENTTQAFNNFLQQRHDERRGGTAGSTTSPSLPQTGTTGVPGNR